MEIDNEQQSERSYFEHESQLNFSGLKENHVD